MTDRVVFSCVAENRADFATMAHNLAISIRSFGGALAEAPIVVNFVDAVEPTFARPLAELEVEIRVVDRVPGRNPLANKLRMLELHEERDFDVLLALDCDVVVVGDPSPWVDAAAVAAKPADFDRFRDEEWRGLFAALEIPLPARTLTATATGQAMYPYFNSGVVSIPRALCGPLGQAWMETFARVSALLQSRPDLIREQWRWLTEQASLAFAILAEGLPWRALPAELNFPTHVDVVASALTADPVILHYHQERDERGFLLRSRTPAVDPWLDAFNRRRAAIVGASYPGIARRPLRQRAARTLTERFWSLLADRRWYRSPAAARMRAAVKRRVRRHA